MERSEQIGDLIAALAKAQGEFTPALKETENSFYGSKYADLAANIAAVRPALSKHGVALVQLTESDLERQVASVTTSLHHGDQFISITTEAPAVGPKGFNVQSLGAAWTYLRRYTLQAITGLASEDDDGNSVATDNKPIANKQPVQKAKPAQPAKEQPAPAQVTEGVWSLDKDILNCVAVSVQDKRPTKNICTVTWNGKIDGLAWGTCFDTELFPALLAAQGLECKIRIKQNKKKDTNDVYFSIIDVFEVAGVVYVNGKPSIDVPVEGE